MLLMHDHSEASVHGTDWYRVSEAAAGVLRIVEPAAVPLASCNAWLVRGQAADLLVDTGVGPVPLLPVIRSVTGREPLCLLTHSHYDHIGAAHEFGVRLAHTAEASIMAAGGRQATLAEGWLGHGSFSGWPDGVLPPDRWEVPPARPTRLVGDGATIDLGGRLLTVVHLPGHSPGLVGLWDPACGLLITSDALYDGPMFHDLPGSDRAAFCASLARIGSFAPSLVLPGHFEPFTGDRAAALVAERLARIGRH